MKKIMFNDRYGLTKAVLYGSKTMTRRIVPDGTPLGNWEETEKMSRFKVGEVVAVAQKYSDFRWPAPQRSDFQEILRSGGWNNKMFVRADLMIHQIRITGVQVERLQDITDEDCLLEGIERVYYGDEEWFKVYDTKDGCKCAPTPKEAFAALIDKVSGNGTWERNPWVFVYEFELVK